MGISPSKSLIISGVSGATLGLATLAFLGSSVPDGVWMGRGLADAAGWPAPGLTPPTPEGQP